MLEREPLNLFLIWSRHTTEAPVGFTGNPQIKSRSVFRAEVRSTTEHSRVHVAAAGKHNNKQHPVLTTSPTACLCSYSIRYL